MAPKIRAESSEPLTNATASYSGDVDSSDPIAIVGMACRWPGDSKSGQDVDSLDALWELLHEKRDAYSDFPAHRINIDTWYHPDANRPGSFYTRGGAFLKADPRLFDPSFFGINPQEAMTVDPAQRKFLEVVFEAFESGGVALDKISGSKTGCFVGSFTYDHQLMQYRDTEYPQPYSMTGGGTALLSNRVSYVFNLQGPSMTLDTACSSSMYALHLACTAIQSGDCEAAVVGGANLILTPECQVFSSSLGTVSKTSRCHTFDAASDGYARADGIGALYIKSLRQALADNDPIRAIIRGTAINANGKTGGITHPDPSGQETVIRRAYERAGISDFGLTSYFECHGTGTPVGDPLEVEAVGRVFSKGRTEDRPLLIGSIKSNLGHSEPASGIAGIMKSVLALEHGVIPPLQKLENVNPNLDLRSGSLKIVQENTPWPDGPIRRASVNSLGFGGANAHTILDAIDGLVPGRGGARKTTCKTAIDGSSSGQVGVDITGHVNVSPAGFTSRHPERLKFSQREFFLLTVSAHNERTLKTNIETLGLCADRWRLLDLSYTLGCRRSTFSNRSFVVAKAGQAEESLRSQNMEFYQSFASSRVALGFVFTGQGSQWPQMGLELMDSFPTYQKSIRDMDNILGSLSDPPNWRIEDCLRAKFESSPVHSAELSQPLVTAVQVALVDLLASWNIRSKANVGHSSGEIAAAYASGRITGAEAILTAYARGRAISRNKRKGAMLAVGLGVDGVKGRLGSYGTIHVACFNSPESVTLSGDAADILVLEQSLAAEKTFARVLATGGNAYHSHHMIPLGEGYEEDLNSMLRSLATLKGNLLPLSDLFSSKDGVIYLEQRIDSAYWRSNLESPVFFQPALASLVETSSVDFLLEIGPHTSLKGPIRQISKSMPDIKFPQYIPTMTRDKNGAECLLQTAGLLFAKGYKVAMERVNAMEALDIFTNQISEIETGTIIVDLPKYQWQYGELLYAENRWTREWRLRSHPRHDILGSRSPGGNKTEPSWRNVLRHEYLPWLADHKIGTDIVFPASAYLCMAIEAVTQMSELKGVDASQITKFNLQDVSLDAVLLVPESGSVEVLFGLRPAKLNPKIYRESLYDFTVTSVVMINDSDVFTEHCHGRVGVEVKVIVESLQERNEDRSFREAISASQWYDAFRRIGFCYGPAFRALSNINAQGDGTTVKSRVNVAPTSGIMMQESRYFLHPAALDSVLQLAIIAAHRCRCNRLQTGYSPLFLRQMSLWPGKTTNEFGLALAQSETADTGTITADVTMKSSEGVPILTASDIHLVRLETRIFPSSTHDVTPFTRMEWRPDLDLLNRSSLSEVFPSAAHELGGSQTLDILALHQIIQFHAQYPEVFDQGSPVPHLQRFLNWMTGKVNSTRIGEFKDSIEIMGLTISERDQAIARLFSSLMDKNGPEARLMSHIYESLPAIYRGEMTGIEAAVQDHLLDDMYKYMTLYRDGNGALKEVVALLSHKTPRNKVFEVGGGTGSATREILPALRGDSPYRGYESYTFTDIGPAFLANAEESFKDFQAVTYKSFDMQTNAVQQGFDSDFDIVIASNVIHATTNVQETLANIRRMLKPGGKLVLFEFVQPRLCWNMILGTFSDFWNGDADPNFPRTEGPFLTRAMWNEVLPLTGYRGVDIMMDHFTHHGEAAIIVATALDNANTLPRMVHSCDTVNLVYRDDVSPFISDCANYFHASGVSVQLVALMSIPHMKKERVISLVEADRPFFLDASSNAEWEAAKQLMLLSESILWVTRGSLLTGGHPEYALVSGIASAIHSEHVSSRLVLADLDRDESFRVPNLEALVQLENRAVTYNPGDDFEFRLKCGVVHTSRLAPDEALNAEAKATLDGSAETELVTLGNLGDMALTITSENMGRENTVYFEESTGHLEPLEEDCVQIKVKAFGLNGGQKLRNFSSKSSAGLCSSGCAGVVTRIGRKVTTLTLGDRVFCLCPMKLGTQVRTKAAYCQVMEERDIFEEAAAIPEAVCRAIYGLHELCKLATGETVLIQSASSSVGQSACQIALISQANIYAIVESTEARQELLALDFGIPESQIFETDNESITGIMQHTGGRGVDVILSCWGGDQCYEYWGCLAPFGRIIHVGGDEHLEAPYISMSSLPRGATFASFDLSLLGQSRSAAVSSLMVEAKRLYSLGTLRPPKLKIRPIAEIEEAVREVPPEKALVLSFEDKGQKIKLLRPPHSTTLEPDSSYLLVGCLEGLGKRFVKWMVERGARNLIFLSRSGLSEQEAKDLVSELEKLQVKVTVVEGDVTKMTDVQKAVDAGFGSIRGVVQAPLIRQDDASFNDMTLERFNANMQPRVIGTLNLHHALQQAPLDFFILWSSWTTILDSTLQSNCAASNSFMEAFGRHRQALGMSAISLSAGQILDIAGVSHAPEDQEKLQRGGLYGNTEDEFFSYCDAALAASLPGGLNAAYSNGHLLAGLTPSVLSLQTGNHAVREATWHNDPRFSHLLSALEHSAFDSKDSSKVSVAEDDSTGSLLDRIHTRLGRLLYMPKEEIDVARPMNAYGIDSMVAAELRRWLFEASGVEVGLLDMLHPGMTIGMLTELAAGNG